IATAYFLRGRYSQAFGVYAAERSGAPIQAYVRVDDEEITNFNQIREPDHVIVLDPTLIRPQVLTGLADDGWVILNTPKAPEEWTDTFPGRRVATIDATAIAVENGLGTRAVPIVNSTMIGAIGKVLGLSYEEVAAALEEIGFGGANLDAARQAYEGVGTQTLEGEIERPTAPPPPAVIESLLSQDVGGDPAIRTGSWATRVPLQRDLDPPCNHACPAGNDVQGFVRAVAEGKETEALRILLETSPLPGICGRVCPAPCMEVCNRRGFDDGVNVRELERWVSDQGEWPAPTIPSKLERVAIVGSGPAGLSAAYHLARLGYHVSLFEAQDELGGVLRNGIPEYRLPKAVLDREIGFILMHGVTAYTDARIDRNALVDLRRHYAAVFVATGLQHAQSLDLGGEHKVMQGIGFLDRVHRRDIRIRGERVIVIGGGNTAIDAARSARRLGAESVSIVYRRSRAEMPAIAAEIDAAIDEGIDLYELMAPERLRQDTLQCARMELGEPDGSGRRRPIPIEGPDAEVFLPCDRVILALGQSADLSILEQSESDEEETLAPVFTGGDLGKNEGTVTAAIGSGRFAALTIHQDLTGEALLTDEQLPVATEASIHTRLFTHEPRNQGNELPADLRWHSFAEVHTGFGDSADKAALEAKRCFSCGVCNECDRCIEHCPEGILTRDTDGYRFDYDYCKGCGICATECPRGVIAMSELQG
ncbi:MAG: FAD-dependent oxidoreductase, partial [Thermoanaerobaculia bacterium]|nr:FAD-dependent oxidoreductase [Thermoanaerobaculia bacterium]